jgi:hypothetical protein
MEVWMCPHCGQRIYGSLEVVLILASAHKCGESFRRTSDTTCLSCLVSPTGLCGYHTILLVNRRRFDAMRVLSW